MEIIKFSGKNKKESIRKAISFFYDNFNDNEPVKIFLAKCRLQKDGITVHFYPNLILEKDKLTKKKSK